MIYLRILWKFKLPLSAIVVFLAIFILFRMNAYKKEELVATKIELHKHIKTLEVNSEIRKINKEYNKEKDIINEQKPNEIDSTIGKHSLIIE